MRASARNDEDMPAVNAADAPPGRDGQVSPEVLAQRALRLAEIYQTPPVPKTYEVWYACAAGNPEKLRRKIEAQIGRNGSISPYEIDQYHQEFLSLSESQRRQQELAHSFFDKEVQKAIELVQGHIGSSDKYAGSLERTASAMSAATNPQQFTEAVGYLLGELSKLRTESVKLNRSLHQTRVQVRRLSASLEKARENELRDPLTAIANRRFFDRLLPRYMADARPGSDLCLVMADLDHFKSINDTFGHQVGDDVLKYFAALLQQNVKGQDVAARFGGEEFALILPFTRSPDARTLVGQIVSHLKKANLVVTRGKDPIGSITCSFGIAQMRPDDTVESLIGRADQKLYEAKQNGRNRIVSDV